ncbi:hypothetical protein [Pseudomonas sp. B329]|uniref:MrpH family fimbial adhesin n=1 Tax=Pseudomonas sp. B329 TaxID=1553459 RepID=UPI00200696A2|nr:hypothetical protein [Pseudomonas sp. B329]MCK3863858.1 hypothetical protein [Pseudomonas sp. B329]
MRKFYRITLRSTLLAVLSCAAMAQAQAYNIVSTGSQYESQGVRYFFEVTNWSPTDPSPSPCETANPEKKICRVALSGIDFGVMASSFQQWDLPAYPKTNLGTLLVDLQSKGFQAKNSILVDRNRRVCISFLAAVTSGGGVQMAPFGPCTPVMAPALQCDIQGDTTIDHKSLPDNALDGAKASLLLNVQCKGGPASLIVSASRSNSNGVQLRSDGSLYSKITVNNEDATQGINVQVSDGTTAMLNITSTLSTHGTVEPGSFSGSTVVTVSPP